MLEKFERYPLTFGPTPIEKLSRLTEHLGGDVEIYAKREDCNSGLALGGNKLRKLEYIVPDAKKLAGAQAFDVSSPAMNVMSGFFVRRSPAICHASIRSFDA